MLQGVWPAGALLAGLMAAGWILWPARFTIRGRAAPGRRYACLRVDLLAVRLQLTGREPRDPGGGPPGGLQGGLRVRIFGMTAFEKPLRLAPFLQSAGEDPPGWVLAKMGRWRAWTAAAGCFRGVLVRGLAVHGVRATLAVGTGDAATTAWLTGALWQLWGGACPVLGRVLSFRSPPRLRVDPVFHGPCFRVRLLARASLRQGWLLWLGCLMAWHWASRTWTSRRSGPREGSPVAGRF